MTAPYRIEHELFTAAFPHKVAVQLADGTISTVEVTGYSVASGGHEVITLTRWEKLLRAFTPRRKRKSLLRPLPSPRVTLHTDDDPARCRAGQAAGGDYVAGRFGDHQGKVIAGPPTSPP